MCVRSLGQEDSLKKELATCSSILAWKVPWTEVTGGYGPWGHKTVRHDCVRVRTHTHTHTHTQCRY